MPAAHACVGVLVDFLCGGWGAESEPRKNRGCPSKISVFLTCILFFILSIAYLPLRHLSMPDGRRDILRQVCKSSTIGLPNHPQSRRDGGQLLCKPLLGRTI
jgi:hypothetical protein